MAHETHQGSIEATAADASPARQRRSTPIENSLGCVRRCGRQIMNGGHGIAEVEVGCGVRAQRLPEPLSECDLAARSQVAERK